jgi:hypothetical protein
MDMKIIALHEYFIESHYQITCPIPMEHDSIEELRAEYNRLYSIAKDNIEHNRKENSEYRKKLIKCQESDSFLNYSRKSMEYRDMVINRSNYDQEKIKEILSEEKKFLAEYNELVHAIPPANIKPSHFEFFGITVDVSGEESIEFVTLDEWFETNKV